MNTNTIFSTSSIQQEEINDILDFWIELIRLSHIKENNDVAINVKQKAIAEYNKLIKLEHFTKMVATSLKHSTNEVNTSLKVLTLLNLDKEQENYNYLIVFCYSKIYCDLKASVYGIDNNVEDIFYIFYRQIIEDEHEVFLKTEKKFNELVNLTQKK